MFLGMANSKSYLHVSDLINAMLFVCEATNAKRQIFNVGQVDDGASVRFIAEEVVRQFFPKQQSNLV